MKNTKVIVWILAAVVVVGLGAVLLSPQDGGGVENVDTARLQELASQGVRIIDVRTSGEFTAGHIPGAENVPVNQVQAASASWDPAQPIALYCATGERSSAAVDYLTQAGFQQIYHFNAGMIAWAGDVERGEAVAAAPVPTETFDTPVLYEFYTDW